MGTVLVEPGKVSLKLLPGVTMTQDGVPTSDRVMTTDPDSRDWVQLGRASFHIIDIDGRYVLRLADNQSEVRKRFGGRVWFGVDEKYLVDARFVQYKPAHKISIVNVIGEVSDETAPGYVEFTLAGKGYRLDALDEDGGLFIILRDDTAGKTTYGAGRSSTWRRSPPPAKRSSST